MKFIIETSASTGAAKKVIVDEQAYIGMAEVDCADLGITSHSVIAMDRGGTAGWLNFYRARVSGARLAIVPHNQQLNRQWIIDNKITHLNTLATTFRWLAAGLYKFPTVESLEIGGEMVDWADARLAFERFPNAVFYNRYAASEARIICRKRLERDQPTGEGRMPVGKPVNGVEIILDIDRVDSITGLPVGEIVVKSPYLSDGYYNDPELTAAKFKAGWYNTGDLGYWLPFGELMHCGRAESGVRSEESGVRSEETHDERLAKWTLAGG